MSSDKPIIRVIDVTNRDGVQTAKLGLAKLQKTMINIMLNDLGVWQSEFGFPVTNHETEYLNANLELAERELLTPMRLSGWMRAITKDVEVGMKNVPNLEHMNLSMSTSEQMIKGKFKGKLSHADIIERVVEAVELAKKKGAKSVGVNSEDASRTKMNFLIEFSQAAKEAGADRIRYCDTLGYDDPFTAYKRIKMLAEAVRIPIEMHFHNDLGMAVGCTVAGAKGAVDAGVCAYANTTVNGMGERAGNADMVSTILAIKKSSGFKRKYKLDPRINLKRSWHIAKYASYALGIPIPINQPGVGENAFAHESGIHADGALKDSRNYELYDFEELGRGDPEIIETGRQIFTGEYSGIKGFRNLTGRLQIKFKDDKEARNILELVRYANVHTQLPVTEDELMFITHYPEQAKKIMTVTPGRWEN